MHIFPTQTASGLLEPVSCRISKCIITMNKIENGSRKSSTKNRFRVGHDI